MSKFQLTEVSRGQWLCKVEGFAPLPLVSAPDRNAALAQIRTRLGDTARMAAALAAPVAPRATTSVTPSTSDAQLAAEVKRLEREINALTAPAIQHGQQTPPAPPEHAARMSAAFRDGSSKPAVTFDGVTQRFSLRGGK